MRRTLVPAGSASTQTWWKLELQERQSTDRAVISKKKIVGVIEGGYSGHFGGARLLAQTSKHRIVVAPIVRLSLSKPTFFRYTCERFRVRLYHDR